MSDTAQMKSAEDAFTDLLAVKQPTLDNLKTLCLLEAAGSTFYDGFVRGAPNDGVRELLARNSQEEIGHAHRLKRVIGLLYQEDFVFPPLEQNPYAKALGPAAVVDKPSLTAFAEGEVGGGRLYEEWADNIGNEEAAKLLRLNGREEGRHADRIMAAVDLLPS